MFKVDLPDVRDAGKASILYSPDLVETQSQSAKQQQIWIWFNWVRLRSGWGVSVCVTSVGFYISSSLLLPP